jgi:hypothetical protein
MKHLLLLLALNFTAYAQDQRILLAPDGGSIKITTNQPNDEDSIDEIRLVLNHLAVQYSTGTLKLPFHHHITYTCEKLPTGAVLRLRTSHPDALKAVHQFLKLKTQPYRNTASNEK